MGKEVDLLLVLGLVLLVSLPSVLAIKIISPIEGTYEIGGNRRIAVDFESEFSGKRVIVVDGGQEIDASKQYQDDSYADYMIDKGTKEIVVGEIFNSFEYSFIFQSKGKGNSEIKLMDGEVFMGLRYSNNQRRGSFACYENGVYKEISPATSDIDYEMKIKAFSDGASYYKYEVYIGGSKVGECETRIRRIDKISNSVSDTTIEIKRQKLRKGFNSLSLGPGEHEIKVIDIVGEGDSAYRDEAAVKINIVIGNCGNLICEGYETIDTCPSDCSPIACKDDSLMGDTNGDSRVDDIDKRNLRSIMEGRIPVPTKDCCADINNDNIINDDDISYVDRIITGAEFVRRCQLGCEGIYSQGQCSATKPLICDYRDLVADCKKCGCPEGKTCLDNGACFSVEECKCADIAADEGDSLGYDNIVDENDRRAIELMEGTCIGNQGFEEKFDLNSDGCIDGDDLICIANMFMQRTQCSGIEHCKDGTLPGRCSTKKPGYCDSFDLIDDCVRCGCPKDYECVERSCEPSVNFQIMMETASLGRAYIEGSSLYIPVKDLDVNISFFIDPLKDTDEVSIRLDSTLRHDVFIDGVIAYQTSLKKGERKEIDVLIRDSPEYEGVYPTKIIVSTSARETIIPVDIDFGKEINLTKVKKSIILLIIAAVLSFLIIVYIILRRNRKDKELMRRIEGRDRIIMY